MSNVLRAFKNRIREIYEDDSFPWSDTSYTFDWIVVLGFFLLNNYIRGCPVFERDFSPDDPLIQHPYSPQQRIPSLTNNLIAALVPVVLAIFIGGYRGSMHEIHHGLLASIAGNTLNRLITDTLKNRVGRLRPDFLSRCQWDALQHVCTGDMEQIIEGRQSFPSGHASTAFVGMTFVSLFFAGKTAALCFNVAPPFGSFLRSRLIRLCLILSPMVFATWVAVTRIEDYRHHTEDVIVGGLIGIFSGTICYHLYWPNPFSASSFSAEKMGRPRLVFVNGVVIGPRDGGYGLAPEGPDLESG